MKTDFVDFTKFCKFYRLDDRVLNSPENIKSFVRIYIQQNLKAQIEDMVLKNFTLKMMFLSITQGDKELAKLMNFNTFKSWVRTNIHKGELKAQLAQQQFYDMKKVSCDHSEKGMTDRREKAIGQSSEQQLRTPNIVHQASPKMEYRFIKASTNREQSDINDLSEMLLPNPKLPLREMTADECKKIFNGEFSKIMIDADGCIFDGYSSDEDSSLTPIPSGYEILPEQEGLSSHLFKFNNETICSKDLRSFVEGRISKGFLNVKYLCLQE